MDGLADMSRNSPSIENRLCKKDNIMENTSQISIPTTNHLESVLKSRDSIGVPFSVPIDGKVHVREVLLVDPIIFNDDEEFSRMATDLKRWRLVWGSVLDKWKSTLLLRKSVANSDKYWHPPGTGSSYRFIRSKRDLQKFLDMCCEKHTTKTNSSGTIHVDFVSASLAFSKL